MKNEDDHPGLNAGWSSQGEKSNVIIDMRAWQRQVARKRLAEGRAMSADGTWIPLYQSVRDHRKTFALADWLGIEPAHAIGLMANLWCWAVDNARDGTLDSVGPRTLA